MGSKRVSTFIFAFMAIILVLGAIVPLFTSNIPQTGPTVPPTPVPTATVPAPIADLQSIRFDKLYLHPSGLFAVAQPTGWEVSGPLSTTNRAAVTMINDSQLSVVEASVEPAETVGASLEALDARYDDAYLTQSWANYGNADEAARRVEDDKLVMDFNLTLNRQQYVARQVSWTDGDWIYNTRVVAPSNATDQLVYVLNGLVGSMTPFKQFAGTPFDWQIVYDAPGRYSLRHPAEWVVEDTAPGRPTSITSPDGATVRVETRAGETFGSAGDVEAWIVARHPDAVPLSAEPLTRGDASGFSVAYSYATPDGDPMSGLALVLTGDDGTPRVANLTFPGEAVDLNAEGAAVGAEAAAEATPEATAEAPLDTPYATYAQILATFTLLPAMDLANAPATPTPLPTAVPAPAATEAATGEAEATTDATAEATSES